MIKRILIANIIVMLTIGFNAIPALAYTELKTPVSVTATGTLTGTTATFTVDAVDQSTGANVSSQVSFGTSGTLAVEDSGRALKITGGTNKLNSRVILYTDNNSYFSTGHDPSVDLLGNPTGIDGAGMPGQTEAAYVASMFWGVNTTYDAVTNPTGDDPNDNTNYVFSTVINADNSLTLNNANWIVDKRHTCSFTTKNSTLDNNTLYTFGGTPVTNTANDGLYPQRWDEDLYNSATVHTETTRVSPALYGTIATVAFNVSYNGTDYLCNVPKLSTPAYDDNVVAKLGPTNSVYLYVGADFRFKPAQKYETTKLNLAIVQD